MNFIHYQLQPIIFVIIIIPTLSFHNLYLKKNLYSSNSLSSDSKDNFEKDSSWTKDYSIIWDSKESPSSFTFQSLKQLGLNVSNEISGKNIVPYHVVSGNDLFCNRELNMAQIDAIGFDMDFTLAQYTKEFDLLAYEGAKEKLVNWLGYPKEVLNLKYDQTNCRRGCMIDKKRGNIIKLDRHKYVRQAFHGITSLSDELRKSLYRDGYNEMGSFTGSNFVNIDTPFSLVDGCLFAQLVDLFDHGLAAGFDGYTKTYEKIWSDLRRCVDRCHKDGAIKLQVAKDPKKYIIYDQNLFPMLKSFREAGKKIFLLTNSLWDYTQVVMNYLEGKKVHESIDLKWTEYFDIIITGGNKPAFLEDEGSLQLFRVDPITYALTHNDNIPSDSKELKNYFSLGKIFQGGNAKTLYNLLQITSGDRLLYVGDHVYADVLRSKRTLGWRTVLIVPELTSEILSHKKSKSKKEMILKYRREQYMLQNQLDAFEDICLLPLTANTLEDEEKRENIEQRLLSLKKLIKKEIYELNNLFHPRWGSIFKAGLQDSRFAKQIADYACLYTSRASNLGNVSPEKPYRAGRDILPHDIDRPLYKN